MNDFPRLILPLTALTAVLFTAGCAALPEEGAKEEESASGPLRRPPGQPAFYGPGSSLVRRGQFPPVAFGEYDWQLPESEAATVKAVAAFLKAGAEQVILAGGAETADPEYARQLGQQRAQTVQRALMKQGIPAARIITASYGQDLPGRRRNRVEFGFIQTAAAPAETPPPVAAADL